MIGQHDAARADADGAGAAGNMAQGDGGRRTGDARHRVMLGHPITCVAETLRCPRKLDRIAERIASVPAFDDRRQIENRELYHSAPDGPPIAQFNAKARAPDWSSGLDNAIFLYRIIIDIRLSFMGKRVTCTAMGTIPADVLPLESAGAAGKGGVGGQSR